MPTYWAIAKSSKYPDICVKEIEAADDSDALEKAREWHREDIGFRYNYVVARQLGQ